MYMPTNIRMGVTKVIQLNKIQEFYHYFHIFFVSLCRIYQRYYRYFYLALIYSRRKQIIVTIFFMKKEMLSGLTAVAAGILIAGCSDTFNPNSSQNGRIYACVDLDTEVINSAGSSNSPSRQATAVTASQLAIDLNSDDGRVSRHWDSLDLFPADEDFPTGAYTMEASYGAATDQGYDKPYYHGSARLNVKESETTPVSITATLANAMVSVTFTDNFRKFFQEYTPQLITAGDTRIAYDREEPCYVTPGAVTLQLDVTKFTGSTATLTPKTFTAEPCHHYRLTVDVDAQAGEGQLILKYDEMLATEDVIIDLSDELINAPAPTLTPNGFASGDEISFISGNAPAETLKFTLIAHGGISSLAMSATSASLLEQGWPAEADLAAGDAALAARLKALGLSSVGLSRNPEKMAVVDLTEVTSHIEYIDGADNTTTLTFTARDNYGKVSEPLTLTFAVQKLEMSLSDAETVYEGETQAACRLNFNGNDPSKVVIQTRNARGTWENVEAVITPLSRAGARYHVLAKGVPSSGEVHLRATYGNQVSAPIIIERAIPPYALTHRDIDVFATSAKVTLIDNPAYTPASRRSRAAADVAATAELYASTDGGVTYNKVSDATLSGTTWTVTGLTPGSTYHFRATADSKPTAATTLATEEATQLPNSDMETWYRVAGKTSYWWIDYPGADENAVWGTLNQLTTSVGDGNTSMFSHKGTSYCAFSGTRPTGSGFSDRDVNHGSANTEKPHTGNYAAVISTVGWGDNDGNGGTSTGKGCKNLTPGELYLGKYDASTKSANYTGLAFGSRPSSLQFHYYYCTQNTKDYGYVEITVADAAGNTLATGNMQLTATPDYQPVTIPLNYGTDVAKAARIFVRFKSSDNSECHKINTTNLSCPRFGNLSNGRFTGSELFVDDLKLNY